MEKYPGKPVNQGIAAGRIKLYKKTERSVEQPGICDPEHQIYRFKEARKKAEKQLNDLYKKALDKVGRESAAIFEMQGIMLEDLDYTEFVHQRIRSEKTSAENAAAAAGDYFSSVFSAMDDEYMKERGSDIKDITERLINCLQKGEERAVELKEPAIVLAEDLMPSETVQLDRDKVLGLVTVRGSVNSHTAILARMLNIPALVGVNISLDDKLDQKDAMIDGNSGVLIIDPDEAVLKEASASKILEAKRISGCRAYIGKDSMTKDGRKIKICANIGNVEDLPSAKQNDADGIGLFRSEFLFLGRDTCPTEEEQFQAYRTAAESLPGKIAIIRTLDIGADKRVSYFNLDEEENPAMGYRAIRICLTRTDLFKTQLRAIYRASAFGKLAVMYPMIISVSEIKRIREIVEEVKAELTNEGVDFREMEQGVMIETPASVMISEELAREVDFLSIGTNDLTQYTLAIDRQNDRLDEFYDPHHPAVLKMIQMTIDNGHKYGCWVGICGELGADISLTQTFIRMGIDELSVSPASILPIRKLVCNA